MNLSFYLYKTQNMKWLIITGIFILLTNKTAGAEFNEFETRLRAIEMKDRLKEMRAQTIKMKENALTSKKILLNDFCSIGSGLIHNPLLISMGDWIKEARNQGLDPTNCSELFHTVVYDFLDNYYMLEPLAIMKRFFMMGLDMSQRLRELQTISEHIKDNLEYEIEMCKKTEKDCGEFCTCSINLIFDDIISSGDPIRNSYVNFKIMDKKTRKFFNRVVRNPFSLMLWQTIAIPVRRCLRALKPL